MKRKKEIETCRPGYSYEMRVPERAREVKETNSAMAKQSTHLIPFEGFQQDSTLRIQVQVERTETHLIFNYLCEGDVEHTLFPTRKDIPQRLDQLWEHTCFEAFVSVENSQSYWEMNMSPSGDWNLYHFDGYRNNARPATCITAIQSQWSESKASTKELKVFLELRMLLPENPKTNLELGLSAVIEKKDHLITYWALTHAGSQPDFHLRESFILKI